jgi:peroxiredoxin
MKTEPILIAVILFLLFSCKSPGDLMDRQAPDFMLSDIHGQRFYLNEHRGKVILLNFWSIHCVPCQAEMPQLERVWQEYKEKDVVFAGLCTDRGEEGYIDTWLKGLGITYTILLDKEQTVAGRYQVSAFPTTFLLDKDGIVRYYSVGYREGDMEKLKGKLELMLTSK